MQELWLECTPFVSEVLKSALLNDQHEDARATMNLLVRETHATNVVFSNMAQEIVIAIN